MDELTALAGVGVSRHAITFPPHLNPGSAPDLAKRKGDPMYRIPYFAKRKGTPDLAKLEGLGGGGGGAISAFCPPGRAPHDESNQILKNSNFNESNLNSLEIDSVIKFDSLGMHQTSIR